MKWRSSLASTKKKIAWKKIATFKGEELLGLEYEALIPLSPAALQQVEGKPYRIIHGDFVNTQSGTGIVHTAPAFGVDDYAVGKKNNLGFICLVDAEGKFVDGVGDWSGRYVKDFKGDPNYQDVNVDICVWLKQRGLAFKIEKYEHSYPHCWRTDKPVLYYPLDVWFIKTSAVKDRLIELNKTINWKPAHTGTGRFGNWLENLVDWNLSRSRFWGTPLPIWKTKNGEEEVCIGSIQELTERYLEAKKAGYNQDHHFEIENGRLQIDLHKPNIDDIVLLSAKKEVMYRENDLADVWFDSGAMPYAQWHYPFDSSDLFQQNFPADFICEGVDQTRGWFYSLHVLACLLFDSVAFKNVMSNGLVLDKDGNKMSKRLGNVVEPFEVLNTYGTDATRWYLITNASPWENMKFDVNGIVEVQRKLFGTLFNTYQFFVLYANVDGFQFKEAYIPLKERTELDQWILSELNTLLELVKKDMSNYEPTTAARAIDEFVDRYLSNWYVRLNRRRFWKGDYEKDKIAAFQTLYECLETIAILMAPVAPYFADWLYKNLNDSSQMRPEESVHFVLFPPTLDSKSNADLEHKMRLAQELCSLVLGLRKKENIRVRQPLQKLLIPIFDSNMQSNLQAMETLIKSETNVKEIEYIAGSSPIIKRKLKANFSKLGVRLAKDMKFVSQYIQNLNDMQIAEVFQTSRLQIKLPEGREIEVEMHELEVLTEELSGWKIAHKESLTVALDIQITPTLMEEGIAREFINRVQQIRKQNKLHLSDRIRIQYEAPSEIESALQRHQSYILNEILALEMIPSITNKAAASVSIDIEGKTLELLLELA